MNDRARTRLDEITRKRLGTYLRTAAQAHDCSGRQLATALGWDASKVSRLFSGELIKRGAYEELTALLHLDWEEALASATALADTLERVRFDVDEDETSSGGASMDRETRIITICAEKGGVGKTTMAATLAAALQEEGRRVLLLDLDAQANATALLCGQYQEQEGGELLRALEGLSDEPPVLETEYGVAVIPSGRKMTRASRVLLDQVGGGSRRVRKMLKPFIGAYDYVVIDTPPTLGAVTVSALVAATHVIIPARPDGFSLDAVHRTLQTCLEVREDLGATFELTGLALLGHDRRTIASREVVRELQEIEQLPLLDVYVPHSTVYVEASIARIPVVHYAPSHKAARAFTRLARHLDKLWTGPQLVEEVSA